MNIRDEKFLDAIAHRVATKIGEGQTFGKELVGECMVEEINAQAKMMAEIEQGTARGKAAEQEMARRIYNAIVNGN